MSTKVKVTLTDSWMYLGTTYLPGVHALDESIATILVARGATSDVQPIAPVTVDSAQPVTDGNAGIPNGEPPAEPTLESIRAARPQRPWPQRAMPAIAMPLPPMMPP